MQKQSGLVQFCAIFTEKKRCKLQGYNISGHFHRQRGQKPVERTRAQSLGQLHYSCCNVKYKYFLTVWLFSYFCESLLFPYGISCIGLLAVISCNDHCLCCVNNTIHLSQSCTTSGNPMTGRQRRTIFTKLRVSSTCGGGGGGINSLSDQSIAIVSL